MRTAGKMCYNGPAAARRGGKSDGEEEDKTNVMRLLDKAKAAYTAHEYDHSDGAIDGEAVAKKLGQDPARVFKRWSRAGPAAITMCSWCLCAPSWI